MDSESIQPEFGVYEAVALFNQIFETATPTITVIGEVANFKINQNKWVFFDLKDNESSLGCFMSVFNLHVAIEDGMKIAVVANPRITKWGKFSLTVAKIRPVGAGAIKRAFELLREKLDAEGLFDLSRKRSLPELPEHVGVISSIDAAGYRDFIKILDNRLGGLKIIVAPTQVQGDAAAEQIIYALNYFNETANPPEVIAILRGGGSRDDLVAFDDEKLVRAVAGSRIPILTGIGHEIDTTLADLAADVRASTPSNAAEILVPDKREILANLDFRLNNLLVQTERNLLRESEILNQKVDEISRTTETIFLAAEQKFQLLNSVLATLDPRAILRRGYAIIRNKNGEILHAKPQISDKIVIENLKYLIESEVKNVREKI